MKTLHQDCMLKVREGLTTMQEALGAVPPDMEEYEGEEAEGDKASS
jgi:type IV pilus assembly protein PilB